MPTLLKALALLPRGRVHVDMVGDGHMLEAYKAELRDNAPEVSAKFWGRLPNARIAERFAQSHVFVLPSVCPENQPVTITEAMACGLAVVGSRIGGIPELVDDGVTGQLFEHGDAQGLHNACCATSSNRRYWLNTAKLAVNVYKPTLSNCRSTVSRRCWQALVSNAYRARNSSPAMAHHRPVPLAT